MAKFTYHQPRYSPLGDFFPQPVNKDIPVYIVESGITAKTNPELLAALVAATPGSPLAATSIIKNGKVVTGTNSCTRNTRILGNALIPKYLDDAMFSAASIAWKHFGFCADKPTPNQQQVLAYTGEDKGFFVAHFDDSYGHMGKLWRNRPDRALTILHYLNDDYDGGEIVFANIRGEDGQPFKYKPVAGDIICFPPHEMYTHEVLPVSNGTRYAISRWYDDTEWFKDFGPVNQRFRKDLTDLTRGNVWRFGHTSEKDPTTVGASKFFDRIFVDDPSELPMVDLSDKLVEWPVLNQLWNALRNGPHCYGHSLQRCYINAHTHGIEGTPHKDSNDRNSFTTIIYLNERWDPAWGGETVFFDTAGKVVRASGVEPFKIIQFRGDQFHVARPVTRKCTELRMTLMFKSRRIVELNPENRPPWKAFG